jgi:membrane-associated HD superfamily phosphohydrolase
MTTNFGALKIKLLHNLTESYVAGKKEKVRETLKLLKENNDFRELYLFYEEIEDMYIEDRDLAERYVEQIEKILQEKVEKVAQYCGNVDQRYPDGEYTKVDVYDQLDILAEANTLKNAEKKIKSRKKLVEILTEKKEPSKTTNTYTSNERLLHTVLATKFNDDFEKNLTESEKDELKKLLSLSNADLKTNFEALKEEVNGKLNDLICEEQNSEVKEKLTSAINETGRMSPTKYNYYKLQQLKNGL